MKIKSKSLIPFFGCRDFNVSRGFYKAMGFEEIVIEPKMSLFKINETRSFYLQDAYVKDWIDNTMLFWEVENLEKVQEHIKSLDLEQQFEGVRVSEIRFDVWGNEFFMHDPAGILWHIGEFK
jgi:hypothetical protein